MKILAITLMCLLLSMQVQAQTITYLGTTVVPVPAEVPPNYGTTAAQVADLFEGSIVNNFANNANLDAMVSGMDDAMIGRLSTELAAHPHPGMFGDFTVYFLADIMAQRLSAVNLHRMAAAFGPSYFEFMQYQYPPRPDLAAVMAVYNALGTPAPNPLGQWQASLGYYVPSAGNTTLYDVFLEYYTAGSGGERAVAAQQMSRYVHIQGIEVFDVVVAVIAILGTYYTMLDSPSLNAAISDLNTWMKANAQNISTLILLGEWTTILPPPPPNVEPEPLPTPQPLPPWWTSDPGLPSDPNEWVGEWSFCQYSDACLG